MRKVKTLNVVIGVALFVAGAIFGTTTTYSVIKVESIRRWLSRIDIYDFLPKGKSPIVLEIYPGGGYYGQSVTLKGKGFIRNNDIGFASSENGLPTGFLNGYGSPDGKTLHFAIPKEVGVCPVTQYAEDLVCPAKALLIKPGPTYISVLNRNGKSNQVPFIIIESSKE